MPITRPLKVFDLIRFDGSTNFASVRKIRTEDGEEVAELRYMRDDGELDFSPFILTTKAIVKICTIIDEDVSRNTRRPVLVGRSTKEREEPGHQAKRPKFDPRLTAWASLSLKVNARCQKKKGP